MVIGHKARNAALTLALVGLGAMGLAGCGGATATSTVVAPTATTAMAAPTATTAMMADATATTAMMADATATTAMMADATATPAMMGEATATTGTGSSDSNGGNSSDAITLLKNSSAAMKALKTYHIKLSVDAGAGTTTDVEGDMQLPDMMRLTTAVAGQNISIVVVDGHAYTQIPGGDGSYMETPFDPSMLSTGDATILGDVAQNATIVGDETIDGAATSHITFSYDADAAAAAAAQAMGTPTADMTPSALGTAQAEMWIDKSTNYIRQFKVTATSSGVNSVTTGNYSKFNETIDPPIEKPTNVTAMPEIPTVAVP